MSKEQLWAAFAAKRAQAIYEAAERKERIYRENPYLAKVDQEIAAAGSAYCAAMVHGKSGAEEQALLAKLQSEREEFLKNLDADIEPKFSCPLCQDTGMTEAGMCDCFKRELIAENFKASNLEQALADQSFENFDITLFSEKSEGGLLSPRENMKRIYKLCFDYAENFEHQERSLLFTGATGLGKTYLSTALAKALLEKGKSVIYISAPEFARRVESARFHDEEGMLEDFFEADMLILDDLGAEGRTAYTIATLTDLMDRRIRCRKPMLFSTNLNLEQLQKAYDERVISRMLGHFTYCNFYGDDLRLRGLGG